MPLRRCLLRVLPGLLPLFASPPFAGALTFGAVGDSLTDEYQGHSDLPALNWVEQLVRDRGLDFGAFASHPALRGEPRNDGWAHNWSRFGINLHPPPFAELNLFDEHPLLNPMPPLSELVEGLAANIASGHVDVAFVELGVNDFLIHVFNSGRFEGPFFTPLRDAVVAALFDVVDTLLAAGSASVVVAALPDVIPPHPVFHPPLSPDVDPLVYADAVAETNTLIQQAAANRGVLYVDLSENVRAHLDTDVRTCLASFGEGCNLLIGDQVIPTDSAARMADLVPASSAEHGPCASNAELCAGANYALTFWTHEHAHPNTIVQGLMANDFLALVNEQFGLEIPPLSDQEILDNALVPEPSGAMGLVLVAALLGWLTSRADRWERPGRACPCRRAFRAAAPARARR
jgi:hypothetical protein